MKQEVQKITDKKIHEVTPIVPDIIAEIVAEATMRETFAEEMKGWKQLSLQGKQELEAKVKKEQDALEAYLTERAETCFQYNADFNKKLKSKTNAGRDYLYMFMFHWAGWYDSKISKIGSYKKSMENWYREMKTYNERNSKEIGGVLHERVEDFSHDGLKTAKELHPLGTVYKKGEFGFVANGYDWWSFPLSELKNIIKNS